MSRSPSPVALRREARGFVPAGQRERCATCAHVQTYKPDADTTELSCLPVGFVTAWAVCNQWKKK